jgi:cytochrome c556
VRPLVLLFVAGAVTAQAPAPYKPKPIANLKQIMRSIPLPDSNLIFEVQSKPPKDEMAWKDIENASMAIAEFANLITIPGRLRENGQPVPVQRADWNKYARGLVAAGQACFKAAQTRKPDDVGDCTGQLSESCSNCHDVYRDRPQPPPAPDKK